ncbi:hypothetical protein PQ472_00410 [Lacticaseibacillus pabuli]|uniref:Uncharacterized protein n=1 Tax=Lacticaseibacillus pabuli TaxID=3025672 RepID=A0ABY7WXS5_9LACO|nr:hypothetical protein [Lacticaseibacillus sp. KACC 23028]WDF82735.1 hypothetical protein PQ472_00410 [Lacticaseibacillus sp. KACC 23028]
MLLGIQLRTSDGILLLSLIIGIGTLWVMHVENFGAFIAVVIALLISFYAGKMAKREEILSGKKQRH